MGGRLCGLTFIGVTADIFSGSDDGDDVPALGNWMQANSGGMGQENAIKHGMAMLAQDASVALSFDAVVIGRNEALRLPDCLTSLQGNCRHVVYVDSGSDDDSVRIARDSGATVVLLDGSAPFTAARARNAGLAALPAPALDFVQFIDGDCALQPGWATAALSFLNTHPNVAAVCGRRKERRPEVSVYNRLCDMEWDTPVGQAKACGGDVMMRHAAIAAAGGFRADLIAGEEPELCVRLRQAGWQVWRIDADMTLHDANIVRFGQWFRRTRRAGHAFAEGAALHGAGPDRHWVAETRRALIWGGALPLAALIATAVHPAGAVVWLAYPAQIIRLARRHGVTRGRAWEQAIFQTLGKFPEAIGALGYRFSQWRGRKTALLEYK